MKKALGFLAAAVLVTAGCGKREAPPSDPGPGGKKSIVVGFSQIGAESAWRTANTESIKNEAAARGIELRFSDAQQKQERRSGGCRSHGT